MILWPAPSTRAQPARAEPLPAQSIKQPQLDLHSRLHNLGTYRVKAPGRDPRTGAPRKEQGPMTSATCGTRSDVKASLTPKHRGRVVENDQYAAFVRRVIAAYSRRVAAGDIDAISDMTRVAAELDDAISQAVAGLRAAGYAWADIAARLGVTRQAAQQRWGRG